MKNLSFAIAILFATGSLSSACMSSDQKKKVAEAEVVNAQDNLSKARNNAKVVAENAATEAELKTFRLEYDLKIKNNEARIADLKLRMNKPGATFDNEYARKIDSFEFKNANLKKRLGDYEQTHNSWAKFKHDFNNDLEDLSRKLKAITNENSK